MNLYEKLIEQKLAFEVRGLIGLDVRAKEIQTWAVTIKTDSPEYDPQWREPQEVTSVDMVMTMRPPGVKFIVPIALPYLARKFLTREQVNQGIEKANQIIQAMTQATEFYANDEHWSNTEDPIDVQ